MEREIELLNYIYQNSQMGMESVEQLINNISDEELKEKLRDQYEAYGNINEKAKSLLHDKGCEEKEINAMEKIMSGIKINVSTMMDNSPVHIAEMMIQGSNMGIIDMTKKISQYEDCDSEIWNLGKKLLEFEEKSMKKWKDYLKVNA